MSDLQEWHRIDKSAWGEGPWQDEPDKLQWVDDATGLDCLIVRNSGGALCGYVGVPESHPWHGISEYQCTASPTCEEDYCDHGPESAIEVHGGLTFADGCHEPTRDRFEDMQARIPRARIDAAQFPDGTSARWLRTFESLLEDFETWRAYAIGRSICHVPTDGRPDRVWWFGFDCGHHGDRPPAYKSWIFEEDVYRTVTYVHDAVRLLAAQLAAVTVSRNIVVQEGVRVDLDLLAHVHAGRDGRARRLARAGSVAAAR